MTEFLASLILGTYDYCKVCGWWVSECGHSQD